MEGCIICMENNNDSILECNHRFCLKCIIKMKNLKCPLCRLQTSKIKTKNKFISSIIYKNNDHMRQLYTKNNIIYFLFDIHEKIDDKYYICIHFDTNLLNNDSLVLKNYYYDFNTTTFYFVAYSKNTNNLNHLFKLKIDPNNLNVNISNYSPILKLEYPTNIIGCYNGNIITEQIKNYDRHIYIYKNSSWFLLYIQSNKAYFHPYIYNNYIIYSIVNKKNIYINTFDLKTNKSEELIYEIDDNETYFDLKDDFIIIRNNYKNLIFKNMFKDLIIYQE